MTVSGFYQSPPSNHIHLHVDGYHEISTWVINHRNLDILDEWFHPLDSHQLNVSFLILNPVEYKQQICILLNLFFIFLVVENNAYYLLNQWNYNPTWWVGFFIWYISSWFFPLLFRVNVIKQKLTEWEEEFLQKEM